MIWGAILKPGEAYTELVVEEIRLSMASLEYRSSKTAVPSPTSHVVISTPKGEYLLCSLEKGSIPQQSLDLVLKPKEEVTFIIEGTGVVHLTGYTQESPQQFVQCSPEEEEMIFVDEQGSDEPDIGSSSQAQNNIDSGGDVATNQVLSEHSSQILNSSKPADTSCQGAIVKMENLSDSPGEDLYEGWIAEDNQLMPKSPDVSEDESNHGNREQAANMTRPIDDGIQSQQQASLNSNIQKQLSSSSLVNQAKGVLKKLKQMPYQCSFCFKEFSSDESLIEHRERHHIQAAEPAGSLNNSVLIYSNVNDCSSSSLVANEADNQSVNNIKPSTCTVGRPYCCKICKTSFTLVTSFIAHQRLHSVADAAKRPGPRTKLFRNVYIERNALKSNDGDIGKQLKGKNKFGSSGRPHLCHYCRKPFSSNSKKILHERRHTGEKPYKCGHCFRGFAAVGDCRRHEQLHTEEGMLNLPRCRYCSKAFYSISKCLIHERIHTGEKPFQCSLCEKAFSQKGHLKTHERTHTGERPYQCQYCDRGFSTGSGRKKHERLHTGKKLVKLK